MRLKRPYWLALLITVGMMVLGFACWKIPQPDFFRGPAWEWQVEGVGVWLMVIGFWGFIASLIWSFVAVVVSFIRRHRAES
jgi:hypothetical protein